MLNDRSKLKEGMTVRSSDGEKLGKIAVCEPTEFIVEKGLFFPKEYRASYEQIGEVRGDEVYLGVPKEHFIHSGLAHPEIAKRGEPSHQPAPGLEPDRTRVPIGTEPDLDANLAPAFGEARLERERLETERLRTEPVGVGGAVRREEARVALREEELSAVKRSEEVGRVILHKEVVTEDKELTVPVRREVVRVEHIAPSGSMATAPGEAFREETITVPIMEEKIEVTKRPVVREEIRVTKESIEEEEEIHEPVRREVLDIDKQGRVEEAQIAATERERK